MNVVDRAVEPDPVAYAREIIGRMKAVEVGLVFGIEARPFGSGESRRFVVEIIKKFAAGRPENLMGMVDAARAGWSVADEALRDMILEHINSGTPLPTYLAAYNMEIVGGRLPRQRGKQKADYILRDIGVLVVLILVMDRFQIAPTSRDGRNTCACSVVSDALGKEGIGIGYKTVASIWNKYKHNAGAPFDGSQRVLK